MAGAKHRAKSSAVTIEPDIAAAASLPCGSRRASCSANACGCLSSIPGMTSVGMSISASRSEEHTSELQSLMRISNAVFCLKKKKKTNTQNRIYSTNTKHTTTKTQTNKITKNL